VEEGDQRLEVAASGGGQEGVDDPVPAGQIGLGQR
jgi:hypothetical protein